MSGYQEVNVEIWVEIAGILKQIIFRKMFTGKVLMDNSKATHFIQDCSMTWWTNGILGMTSEQ